MSSSWVYPFILVAGCLQAAGASMNGQLFKAIPNAWMASAVSFGLVFVVFVGLSAVLPRPLPTAAGLQTMPWWAPIGGIVGAVAVYAGLTFVTKIGAGPFNGLTITANILASLAIDNFGLFRMEVHAFNWQRTVGAVLMLGGVTLIARF